MEADHVDTMLANASIHKDFLSRQHKPNDYLKGWDDCCMFMVNALCVLISAEEAKELEQLKLEAQVERQEDDD